MMLNLNGKAFSTVPKSYLSKETLIVLLDRGYFGSTQSATASLISLIRGCEMYRNICMSFLKYEDEPVCFKCVKNRLFDNNLLSKEERNALNEIFQLRNYLVHSVSLFVVMTEEDKVILKRATETANEILKNMVYRENFPNTIVVEFTKAEMKTLLEYTNKYINNYKNSLKPKVTPIKKEEPERPRETLKII